MKQTPSRAKVAAALEAGGASQRPDLDPIVVSIESKLQRSGKGKRVVVENGAWAEVNAGLAVMIAEAFAIRNQLLSGSDDSNRDWFAECPSGIGATMRAQSSALARPRNTAAPWQGLIPVPNGVRVWLATGHTDMRKGFGSLALLVQETLKRDPFDGNLFIFRGRRGDLIKVIWHDGQGACLFAKRLERGRFIWPSIAGGAVTISTAQMAYLLDGIDVSIR